MIPSRDGRFLGLVVGGSLTRGVEVKLDASVATEEVKAGAYVTIRGAHTSFFGMVTDIALAASDEALRSSPPGVDDAFAAQVLAGTVAYGTLTVLPMLALPPVMGDSPRSEAGALQPARTVPSHFSRAHVASERDIEVVFGKEDARHFWIGNPLEMETRVCLDLGEFVKRSNGVFGKSGTGKTFLTRLLLTGILQGDVASTLVFDMHSEYGWQGVREGGTFVKGLKQLFPSKVAVFSLDEESSRRRGLSPDYVVRVGYDEIGPEDVELLRETLNLSDVAAAAAYNLEGKWGEGKWLGAFLALGGANAVSELAEELNVNQQALRTLHNRLSRLQRFGFMSPDGAEDSVAQILGYLDRGMHVVLEFGRYGNDLTAYMLVANLLTRRIHGRYVRRKEESEGGAGKEPRPLAIVIEEAHRFLNPQVSSQTIFGTIAREMRKYNVTLLVIDQRPSAIDSEVMSQIGTKIACLLDDERDVEAVLAGV
ncbi:MAG: ATP-binding protein, partial [Chloroflexota bacterium]|nr:ATP-binding protein [Chloroflexota bacterium]